MAEDDSVQRLNRMMCTDVQENIFKQLLLD